MRRVFGNSKVSLAIVFAVIIIKLIFSSWEVLTWDAFGYYLYLPLVFYEQTLIMPTLEYASAIYSEYNPSSSLYQFTQVPNGNFIIRYPVGMAVVYAPFFAMGHVVAIMGGYPIDGFSTPYQVCMKLGSASYYLLTFVLLRKVLNRYYRDVIVAGSLLLVFFGTNLLQFLPAYHVMANGTSLFLFAIFIFLVDFYYRNQHTRWAVAIGLVYGLICLTRFTNALVLIPAVLWPIAVHGKQGFSELFHIIKQRKAHIALAAIIALSLFSLQLLYWKIAGGKWILDSYGNPGEGLDFLSPETLNFLFSFRTGWLIYTPLMILVLGYIFWAVVKGKYRLLPFFVFIVIFIYVASSWSNYSYGGGYSQRAMVEALAILVFPLAGFLQKLISLESKVWQHSITGVISVLILLNIWQVIQFENKVITKDRNTAAYYFSSFFDWEPDPEKERLLLVDRNINADTLSSVPKGYELVKKYKLPLNNPGASLIGQAFTPAWKMSFEELCPADHCWLKHEIETLGIPAEQALLVMTFERKEGLYHYHTYELPNIVSRKDSTVYRGEQFYLTPEVRSPRDTFITYLWNREMKAFTPIEISLSVYAKKN